VPRVSGPFSHLSGAAAAAVDAQTEETPLGLPRLARGAARRLGRRRDSHRRRRRCTTTNPLTTTTDTATAVDGDASDATAAAARPPIVIRVRARSLYIDDPFPITWPSAYNNNNNNIIVNVTRVVL